MNPHDPHGLLQAVLDEPAIDIHRLAYADWLNEQGYSDRAEFIRVQLQSSLHPFNDCPPACVRCLIAAINEKRADVLLSAHIGEWTNGLPDTMVTRHCPFCIEQSADLETNVVECRQCDSTGLVPYYESIKFTRGFVSEVRLTMADFMAKDVAGYLFANHPIERVVITDAEPIVLACDASMETYQWMCNKHEAESPWFVPRQLWELIDLPLVRIGGEIMDNGKYAITHSTAQNALFAACSRLGKGVPL